MLELGQLRITKTQGPALASEPRHHLPPASLLLFLPRFSHLALPAARQLVQSRGWLALSELSSVITLRAC